MTMGWAEHLNQSELLLREAAENPSAIPEERLVWVTAALAHAQLAGLLMVVK